MTQTNIEDTPYEMQDAIHFQIKGEPCASYSEMKESYRINFPLDYNRLDASLSSYHHHPSSHIPISIPITTLASSPLSRRLNENKS
jgi:hypothetical protein